MTQQLAVYEHAKEALAAAVRFDEVTQIRSAAEKAAAYAKIARDRKLQADAAEIVARAERKLGIMLRAAKDEGQLSKGGRPANSNVAEPETGADAEPVFDNTPFTLAEIGVDKKLSSRAQKAAELADDAFEVAVKDRREKILEADAPVVAPPKPKPVKVVKPEPVKALEPRRFHQFVVSLLAMSFSADRLASTTIWALARDCEIVSVESDDIEFTAEAAQAIGPVIQSAVDALARRLAELRPSEPVSVEQADAIIRAGYENDTPLADLAVAIGRPGNRNYVKNRARVMRLSSRDRQRAAVAEANRRRAGE